MSASSESLRPFKRLAIYLSLDNLYITKGYGFLDILKETSCGEYFYREGADYCSTCNDIHTDSWYGQQDGLDGIYDTPCETRPYNHHSEELIKILSTKYEETDDYDVLDYLTDNLTFEETLNFVNI